VDVAKLLKDVFDPQPGEVATVAVDLPRHGVEDNPAWARRREMAERWRQALLTVAAERGFTVGPMLTFPATGSNNSDLPSSGVVQGREVDLLSALTGSTLVIAMTEFSATAPLSKIAGEVADFRAASMPGVEARMEGTALAVDHAELARRCRVVFDAMEGAVLCDVQFSTGHRCWFDLRHRRAEMDDGFLPRFKAGDRIINLPSGETFIVPYEGEKAGIPSWTAGTIPVSENGELFAFQVVGNRIVAVDGSGPVAARYRGFFAADAARANVAEVAFGVNDRAEVTGSVLEDEKAGFHWAFGRSDHLGGVTGVAAFVSPASVVHQDIVYARGNPIQVLEARLVHPDGRHVTMIRDGEYVI
jgi:hypothetical protein